MNTILLDTNAYVAFKQGQADAVEIVQRALNLAISSTVLGELLAGFAVGAREAKNRVELQQFLASDRVHILMVDDGTATYYATVYRNLRQKGRPIPTNDMWILHFSMVMRSLATTDTFRPLITCLLVRHQPISYFHRSG